MSKILQFIESRLSENLKGKLELESRDGSFSEFPKSLRKDLQKVLLDSKISKLYEHQKLAFDSIESGKNTLVVSKTASGKTLSFLLPILNEYLNSEKKFTTLLLYPTKALARDQEGVLGKLIQSLKSHSKFGTFDGDTSSEDREILKNSGEFIITNPDMLHSGILPNHNRKWKKFLSNLKYIIIDEVHVYRGSFGSHVSNVISRLIRVCRIYGVTPKFICSSATVGNPKEHAEALFKTEFNLIDKDSSPSPKKNLFFLAPSFVKKLDGTEYRKSLASISVPLIRFAVENKIRTICFCRARQEVEKLYSTLVGMDPSLIRKIRPYRGGLLPSERRQIEQDLFTGKISVIISTNALELGIDIGDLDLCLLNGFPGSFASFWQQAGRVGRKGSEANIAFIGKESPIDQYLLNHPEFLIKSPIEEAWLNSFNPFIFLQHLPCAAYENPLSPNEDLYAHPIYEPSLEILEQEKRISKYKSFYRYADKDYPSKGVSLRGIAQDNIVILEDDKAIGEIDAFSAKQQLHVNAVYFHLGKKYISTELDLNAKIAIVRKFDSNYYTESISESLVRLMIETDRKKITGANLIFGEINVARQPKGFKKISEVTKDNLGYGDIDLPPYIFDTMGFSISIDEEWIRQMITNNSFYIDAAYYGLGYILKRVSPSLCMADTSDIYSDIHLGETASQNFAPSIYIYDSMEGGVGYSEKIFEKFEEVINLCLTIIDECDCEAGCPACVTPSPDEIVQDELKQSFTKSNISVECTKSILEFMKSGIFYKPEIKEFQKAIYEKKLDPVESNEKEKTQVKRAYEMIKRKKERYY